MSNNQEFSTQELTKNALLKDGVPSFYMNSFISGVGLGDAYLVIQTNGKTAAILNMSLPTLKTLAGNLMATIQKVEEKMKKETPTLQELHEKISKE